MTPGYKTTEFWLTLAVNAVATLQASGVFATDSKVYAAIGFVASALATMGYTYGRAMVKASEQKALSR